VNSILSALGPVIALIIKALVELFLEKSSEPDTATVADRNAARRKRLAERVREAKSNPGSIG